MMQEMKDIKRFQIMFDMDLKNESKDRDGYSCNYEFVYFIGNWEKFCTLSLKSNIESIRLYGPLPDEYHEYNHGRLTKKMMITTFLDFDSNLQARIIFREHWKERFLIKH